MNKIYKILFDKNYRELIFAYKFHLYDNLNDEEYLKKIYKIRTGKKLDFNNVKTFNEKLNWLKCYNHDDSYSKMVDKYEAKKIVADLIGEQYIIKTIGIYSNFEEIDFEKLPQKFVLKCTHNSGCLVICKNKNELNKENVKKMVNKAIRYNYYKRNREWPYKNLTPRIIIEEYVEAKGYNCLPVYKFFCFDGHVELCQTIQNDKTKDEVIDYFDNKWNHLDLRQNFPNSNNPLPKPKHLEEMISIASKLSKGYPFIRIDLYDTFDSIYFSEFTFFSDAGFEDFHPAIWDKKLGDLINLKLVGDKKNDKKNNKFY